MREIAICRQLVSRLDKFSFSGLLTWPSSLTDANGDRFDSRLRTADKTRRWLSRILPERLAVTDANSGTTAKIEVRPVGGVPPPQERESAR